MCFECIFHIEPGQTVGIIGGTGSAKSTLVQLIPRLYDVTEGEILIDQIPVKQYPLKHLREAVAMVLQKKYVVYGHDCGQSALGKRRCKRGRVDESMSYGVCR